MAKEAPTRERMEEAEARSEEKYDRPPEPASDAVLTVTRPAGKIVDANAAAAEMLGYSLPELIGLLGPREIVAPEVLEQTQREWVSQMRENGHYCVETVWVHKDGSRIPVKASGKPITLEGQPLLHLIARDLREREGAEEALRKAHGELEMRVKERTAELTSVNERLQLELSERRRSEEALRESEERFRRLAENAPDVIFRYRLIPTTGYEYISPAVTAITGYTPQEFYADPDLDLKVIHPDDRQTLQRMIEQPLSDPRALRWIRKDGAIVWLEHHNAPIYDEEGNLVAVEGVARDITERKQAEEALRESEERFRRLAENAADIIFRYRLVPTPGCEYVSPAITNITGYTPDECYANPDLGHKIAYLDDVPIMDRFLEEADSSGRPFVARMIRKDGMLIWIEARIVPIHDEGGKLVAIEGILRDVTERKRMEEALQAARDELESKVERQLLRRNPYGLTFRELTVLHLVAVGESDKQIGLKLGISHFTAQKHTSNILAKMGAGSRTEATARALREGLLD
jgi:PAS domain S-box-containing protein